MAAKKPNPKAAPSAKTAVAAAVAPEPATPLPAHTTALPSDNFLMELEPVDIYQALEFNKAKEKRGQWFVPAKAIYVLPGYNMRILGDRYKTRVAYLRDNMIENGYDPTSPITVFAALIDGVPRIIVQDGHHRLQAVLDADVALAKKKLPGIHEIPVIFKDGDANLADLNFALLTKNAGEPPAPYEAAIVIKRLVNQGVSKPVIAKKLTVTRRYVDDLLLLSEAPIEIRDAVINDLISPTTAITELRDFSPEDAVKRLNKALAKMQADGKKKVTKKGLEEHGAAVAKKPKRASVGAAAHEAEQENDEPADSVHEFFRLHQSIIADGLADAYMELAFESTIGYAATIQDRPHSTKRGDPKPQILAQGTGDTPDVAAAEAVADWKRRKIDEEAADL